MAINQVPVKDANFLHNVPERTIYERQSKIVESRKAKKDEIVAGTRATVTDFDMLRLTQHINNYYNNGCTQASPALNNLNLLVEASDAVRSRRLSEEKMINTTQGSNERCNSMIEASTNFNLLVEACHAARSTALTPDVYNGMTILPKNFDLLGDPLDLSIKKPYAEEFTSDRGSYLHFKKKMLRGCSN